MTSTSNDHHYALFYYIRSMKNDYLFLLLGTLFLLSSCGSIRTSQRIEYLFLEHYIKDTADGKVPKTYTILTNYIPGSYTIGGHPSAMQHGEMYTIDVFLINPMTKETTSVDQGRKIAELLENDERCKPYLRKFQKQRTSGKINRYGSIAAMGMGITLLSTVPYSENPTKSHKSIRTAGTFMILGGILDWGVGGIARVIKKRSTILKAAYVHEFGPLPKHLPRITRKARSTLIQNTPR